MEYILYCDESVSSDRKYGDFFGGCIVSAKDFQLVKTSLEQCKAINNLTSEIKWTKVTEQYLEKYIQVIRLFFSFAYSGKVKVRIMFRKMENQYIGISKNEKYFKLYYQFIKNAFGFRFIHGSPFNLRIYLDQLPAKKEDCAKFKMYLAQMPNIADFKDSALRILPEQIAEIRSHDHVLLQCVDMIMGAMQFRLNVHHKDKPDGERFRGKKTIAKEKLYKVIYEEICKIHPNFNIGNSTGNEFRKNPKWECPYRHWLFTPYSHQED